MKGLPGIYILGYVQFLLVQKVFMTRLTITADNHYTLNMLYKDAEGYAINIDDATARFVMRRSMYSPILIDRAAVITGDEGAIDITLTPDDTQNILDNVVEEQFVFAVSLIQSDETKTIIASGEVTLQQNIARG
tara:strand:+ start:252 stop:653 length:402 start_codon:yes stop_codon:yes gene_type:complete